MYTTTPAAAGSGGAANCENIVVVVDRVGRVDVVGATVDVVVDAAEVVGEAAGSLLPLPPTVTTTATRATTAAMTAGASHRRRPRSTSTGAASASPPIGSTRSSPLAAPQAGQYRAAPGICAPQPGHRAEDRPTAATVPVGVRRATRTPLLHSPPVAGSSFPLVDSGAVRLPSTCLVVLVGPSGAGKSTWAAAQFRPSQVVSSDALRALVGEGDHDQRAGADAFAVLDDVLERRLRRRLLTVVDSLGLDAAKRRGWLALARRHGVPCHAVVFSTPAAVCRERNRH